ncbi:hypothetical protein JHW45_03485 [Paracoccus stylophorae]|uniref:Uncharacterized protein n=1 Tax=Paracoccus stylophorae TaxID=659350 RepID=A0ABY7SYQ0_9RHOB|nr:hypothetical protein [Paracoccus stylophorae]WCR11472.1 hypothetical protein JHW45_03485 [Paracoccus stylophorae]
MFGLARIVQLVAAAAFVVGGLVLAFRPRPVPRLSQLDGIDGPLFSLSLGFDDPSRALLIPQLYVRPENPVMWALLLAVFAAVAGDAIARSGAAPKARHMRAWPYLSIALLAGAVGPWLLKPVPMAAAGLLLVGAVAATGAAIRTTGQRRGAIGFLAGWMTGVASAAVAAELGRYGGFSAGQTAVLAILPAAIIGMAVQVRLARSFAYSAALIWAFCALAITTMASAPATALAATLGIAAMTAVLIRAAS